MIYLSLDVNRGTWTFDGDEQKHWFHHLVVRDFKVWTPAAQTVIWLVDLNMGNVEGQFHVLLTYSMRKRHTDTLDALTKLHFHLPCVCFLNNFLKKTLSVIRSKYIIWNNLQKKRLVYRVQGCWIGSCFNYHEVLTGIWYFNYRDTTLPVWNNILYLSSFQSPYNSL